MSVDFYPLRVLLTTLAGWMNRQQQDVIAYLVEENRVLREQLKGKRLRLNDDQRRRPPLRRVPARPGQALAPPCRRPERPSRGMGDAHLIRTISDSLDFMDSMDNSQP